MIDSHCHVGEAEYDADRAAVLARARDAGVDGMIVVAAGGDLETNRRALAVAEAQSDCWAVLGTHPHEADRLTEATLDGIRALAASDRVVAIGETGLDFHYDHSDRTAQVEVFRRFARLSLELDLPLVIHSRNAASETFSVLEDEEIGRAVLHCFTYDAAVARRAVDAGYYVSFSGIVTFRKSDEVRDAARAVPLDRLLVETDCPYLSPEPKRGGRNEPARLPDVVRGVAAALDAPADEIAERTAENTRRFFRL